MDSDLWSFQCGCVADWFPITADRPSLVEDQAARSRHVAVNVFVTVKPTVLLCQSP